MFTKMVFKDYITAINKNERESGNIISKNIYSQIIECVGPETLTFKENWLVEGNP